MPHEEGMGHDDIVHDVKAKLESAKEYREPHSKHWPRFYLVYEGMQWNGRQRPWQSTPVINLTWSVIQTIVPILTDSKPQITVVPRQREHEEISSVLTSLLEWLWDDNDMDIKLPKLMTTSMIFGNAFAKVIWDPSARNGFGDIRVVEVDPTHMFVAPNARSFDDADYVIHAENITVEKAQRLIEELRGELDSGDSPDHPELTLDREPVPSSEVSDAVVIQNSGGAAKFGIPLGGSSVGDNGQEGMVTVIELWEKNEEGQVFQTIVVNDRVALHRPSPFSHGLFPFVHFVDHAHSWTFWGMGEVQQVEKLQMEINRRRGHIQDILRYTANPILLVDPALADPEQIDPRPGLVLPVEGGPAGAAWLTPPSIPAELFQSNILDKQDFDVILGNVDVLQGRRPAGVEAGIAIELLQEAANVRMRLKVRHMENSLKRLGKLLVGMIQEFYDTERTFFISGPEALMIQEPLTKDVFMEINKGGENQIPPLESAEFDVKIGAGSTLPVSRAAQFQRVITLYQMGVIDDEEVMRHSGLPRWKETLQRSRQWKFQMAQAQAAMEQQQAGAEGEEEPLTPEEEQEILSEQPLEEGGLI